MNIKKQENFGSYINSHVYRIIIEYSDKTYSWGTGFFIDRNYFLTCSHVVLGVDYKDVLEDIKCKGEKEFNKVKSKILSYFNDKKPKIKIEISDGHYVDATLSDFDAYHDIVKLNVKVGDFVTNKLDIDFDYDIKYGDVISFGGYSHQYGYDFKKWPFAYEEGMVASFPKITVSGGEYNHVRINAINLAGNSGAPVFLKGTKKVIGIVNGHMHWGRDDILSSKKAKNKTDYEEVSLQIPLAISYISSVKLLKKDTNIFNK